MEWVLAEFNGTRKTILREKLPEAEKMAEEMYDLADQGRVSGNSMRRITSPFRIVAEEVNGISDPI